MFNDNATKTGFEDFEDDDIGHIDQSQVGKKTAKFEKRTPTDRAENLYTEQCPQCRGTGKWSGGINSYGQRECFKCSGKGVLTFKTPKAVRDANKIKSADRKAKKLADNLAAFEKEHPVIAAWWTGSDFAFAISLREAVMKFGRLTEGADGKGGQLAAAYRCAEKFNEAKAAREVQKVATLASAVAVDISPIAAAFERAKAKGLKHPKMHLLGGDTKLVFSRAPDTGRNAGAIYVKDSSEGTYLGKVQHGKFLKSFDCTPGQAEAVTTACVDPLNAAIAYGKTFGVCFKCGRDLTDPVSVERGMGPDCAENFFG